MSIFGSTDENKAILYINGQTYDGWEGVSIQRNLEAISGGFSVKVFDKWRQSQSEWTIKPGDEVRVKIGSDTLINGYVDSVSGSFTKDNRSITVEGRDKSGDLVDCSIVSEESQYKDKTLTELATIFCEPFGISVEEETDVGEPFKKWDIQQGESVFDNLDRMAKLRGVLIVSKPDGNIKIVRSGDDRADDEIVQGENLLSGSVSYDHSDRFSEYVVKGQSAGNDNTNGKNASQNKDQATDEGVKRYRPLLVIGEGSSDKTTVKDRAQWEATTRAARGFRLTVNIAGWRQSSGKLWEVNQKVKTKAEFAGINKSLLIAGVTYVKDLDEGTITVLELVRPDSYKPKDSIQENQDPVSSGFGW